MNYYDAEKAGTIIRHTSNVAAGIFLGATSGAAQHSAGSNLITTGIGALAASGVAAWMDHHKFWSKETLANVLVMTATSSIMHLITRAEVERNHPRIAFAPGWL